MKNKIKYNTISDYNDIDLDKHGLIEASAGTGKTFTIENLVVRLIKEKEDIELENILIVTFTEKATAELKIRIREKIEAELAQTENPALRKKLEASLESFDKSAIHTIHGFCNIVLRDFAFEANALFQNEVVQDAGVYETLFKEQMRTVWPLRYGNSLEDLLRISGFNDKKENFISMILRIARGIFRPGIGDILLPDTKGMCFDELRARMVETLTELDEAMGEDKSLSEGYQQLNINKRTKGSLMKNIIFPLEDFFASIDLKNPDPAMVSELIATISNAKSSGIKGIEALIPVKWTKNGNNTHVCPCLEKIVERFKAVEESFCALASDLAIGAIVRLQEDAAEKKRENGWISYDDMLGLVDKAIHGINSDTLTAILRKKYRVAFVDEFQDTDPVQWRIFKKIFLDTPEEKYRKVFLYLIGDPKQAIYSFRGADLFTYFEARSHMARLAKQDRASFYALSKNYRSSRGLIDSFNALFTSAGWFNSKKQEGGFGIEYQKAEYPEARAGDFHAAEDSTDKAITILDLSSETSFPKIRADFASFTADEIIRLVLDKSITIQGEDGKKRSPDWGDICILIMKKSEFDPIEEALSARGIPHTFYKKQGLFTSEAAFNLSVLFHAILAPDDIGAVKASLLTPFFDLAMEDAMNFESLPFSHPIKQLLSLWNNLASENKQSKLFKSILEDSGFMFRQSKSPQWDRIHTDYVQICEHLATASFENKLDFAGVSALLDGYLDQTSEVSDNEDIHRIETESGKVQVMTMHVSKGLQFPVVFIAGGFTNHRGNGFTLHHRPVSPSPEAPVIKVIDLSGKTGKEEEKKEKAEEHKRLFYVAITRAICRCYLPFHPDYSARIWIGPIPRLVSPALASVFPKESPGPNVQWIDAPTISSVPSPESLSANKDVKDFPEMENTLPSEIPAYYHRKTKIQSFSSIHQKQADDTRADSNNTSFFPEVSVKDKRDEPGESMAPADSQDQLPPGPETGSMLHGILENIDFGLVSEDPLKTIKSPENQELFGRQMELFRIDPRYINQVASIISETLTAMIPMGGEFFRLCDLGPGDRLHEVEFLFPFSLPEKNLNLTECEIIKDGETYIRGYIDLIFRRNGKYYLADWKSNFLDKGYGRKSLEESMNNSGYRLQYEIYTMALFRFLRSIFKESFHPENLFGGVFYFYLRGMGLGNNSGIYHVPGKIMMQPDFKNNNQ